MLFLIPHVLCAFTNLTFVCPLRVYGRSPEVDLTSKRRLAEEDDEESATLAALMVECNCVLDCHFY